MIPGDYIMQRPGFSAMNHFAKYGPNLLTTDRNITSGDGSSPSVRTFSYSSVRLQLLMEK